MYINKYIKNGSKMIGRYHIFFVILEKSKILLNSLLVPIRLSSL